MHTTHTCTIYTTHITHNAQYTHSINTQHTPHTHNTCIVCTQHVYIPHTHSPHLYTTHRTHTQRRAHVLLFPCACYHEAFALRDCTVSRGTRKAPSLLSQDWSFLSRQKTPWADRELESSLHTRDSRFPWEQYPGPANGYHARRAFWWMPPGKPHSRLGKAWPTPRPCRRTFAPISHTDQLPQLCPLTHVRGRTAVPTHLRCWCQPRWSLPAFSIRHGTSRVYKSN